MARSSSFVGPVMPNFKVTKKVGKAPKKPKFRAMPKAPKMSASIETWKRYEQRVKDVIAVNQMKLSEWNKKRKAHEDAKRERERIKAAARAAAARLRR